MIQHEWIKIKIIFRCDSISSNGLWLSVCRRFAKIEAIEATEAWTIDKINKTNDNIIEKTIDKIIDKIIDKTNNSADLNLGNATHN